MCRLCTKDFGLSKKISKTIKRIVHKLVRTANVDKIILFGSYARGDYHEGSDIDLILVGNFKEKFLNRIYNLSGEINENTAVDIFPYTEFEFEEMQKNKNPFIEQAIKTGKVILLNN